MEAAPSTNLLHVKEKRHEYLSQIAWQGLAGKGEVPWSRWAYP